MDKKDIIDMIDIPVHEDYDNNDLDYIKRDDTKEYIDDDYDY